MSSSPLDDLRQQLDAIDKRLLDSLVSRQDLAAQIARAKLEGDHAVRDRSREEELLTRIVAEGKTAGLDGYFVTRLFREILEHSVRRQQELLADASNPERAGQDALRIGFQGAKGAYSHLAARKHFSVRDARIRFRGYKTFFQLLEAVQAGGIDYAMLPIENTTAGSINEAYDLLAQMNLSLVGEEVYKVDHCLLALEPVPISNIRRIYSHPKALDQCSRFLTSLSHCHVESFVDTAAAARKIVRDQDLSKAAIASAEAGELYGLHVIKRDIANQKENYTRFVVAAAEPEKVDPRVACKTSIIFATRHEEGALLKCLNVLADHHLSMTKLESRPRPNTPWEYLFYVDVDGNIADTNVSTALQQLAARVSYLKVLGSYPARTGREAQPASPRPVQAAATATCETPTDSPEAGEPAAPITPAQPKPETDDHEAAAIVQMLEKKPYKLVSRVGRPEDTEIKVRETIIGGRRPIVIAGPCSVESREQVLRCAEVVKQCGGDILRGGCFKPRTHPYSFQGHGYDALEWLEEAGQTYALPIITEVMHPSDVERVARHSDILQLGARNMQNFSLLKEVGNVDRPVMLKRGLMASIDEWLAAAEYILAQGNQQVLLCERGIRTFETATRNTLDLSAVPVARERTHLPIIVDPAHAAGTHRWIIPLSEAAIAVGAHGVMIEMHPDPDHALSDGPQQLNFDKFRAFMERIGSQIAARG